MTYEVFSMTDRKKCMKYSETASFDKCNFNQLEQLFTEEIGCSVPFLFSAVSVCKNDSLIQKVPMTVDGILILLVFDIRRSQPLIMLGPAGSVWIPV